MVARHLGPAVATFYSYFHRARSQDMLRAALSFTQIAAALCEGLRCGRGIAVAIQALFSTQQGKPARCPLLLEPHDTLEAHAKEAQTHAWVAHGA